MARDARKENRMATENGKPIPLQMDLRRGLLHRRIERITHAQDSVGAHWTTLTLDTGQQVSILDTHPWVFIDPEVM